MLLNLTPFLCQPFAYTRSSLGCLSFCALSQDPSTVGHSWSPERREQMRVTEGHLHLPLASFRLDSFATGDPGSFQHSREVWQENCSSLGWGSCSTDPVGLNFSKKKKSFHFTDVLGKQSKTELQKPRSICFVYFLF